MTKDLEKMQRILTMQEVKHARDPDKFPSQKERWDQLLKKYPKRKKR